MWRLWAAGAAGGRPWWVTGALATYSRLNTPKCTNIALTVFCHLNHLSYSLFKTVQILQNIKQASIVYLILVTGASELLEIKLKFRLLLAIFMPLTNLLHGNMSSSIKA